MLPQVGCVRGWEACLLV